MTRIKAQGIKFEAVCEVYNRREESRFDVPFLPILYHDTDTGLMKPVGIPLDEPIDVKGSLVFAGFGITGTKGEDPPWDDYREQRIDGKIALVISSVPNDDFETYPREPYASIEYKIANAHRHGAIGLVHVGNPLRDSSQHPGQVTNQEAAFPGICVDTAIIEEALWAHQDPEMDLSSLQKKIETSPHPIGPRDLDLDMRIVFRGNEFMESHSEHFAYRYHPGSLAHREIASIMEQREEAFAKIARILKPNLDKKITCFFFPTHKEKTLYTYSTGAGNADRTTIIELYNFRIKLDPSHELAHVLSWLINPSPMPILQEGLAIYLQKNSQWQGKHVDDWVREYHETNQLIPLEDLFSLREIGSRRSNPAVTYPEAGSFTTHIIRTYGISRLKDLFSATHKGAERLEDNKQKIRTILGKSLEQIEEEWKQETLSR